MAHSFKLVVTDRIILLELLPEKGTFAALKEIRELREELAFSEDEAVELSVTQEDGVVRWDSEKEQAAGPKTVVVSEYLLERVLIRTRQLDKSESIPAPFYDLLLKIGYDG